MSKLDDMKALRGSQLQRMAGDAPKPRAAQKIIEGLKKAGASIQAVEPKPAKKRAKNSEVDRDKSTTASAHLSTRGQPSRPEAKAKTVRGRVEPTPPASEAAPKKIGRPKVIGEPWVEAGMSRRSWYRRAKSEPKK